MLHNETHEMALTMDQYVSGKTYGFHANKNLKTEKLLFRMSDSDAFGGPPIAWYARFYPRVNLPVTVSFFTHCIGVI